MYVILIIQNCEFDAIYSFDEQLPNWEAIQCVRYGQQLTYSTSSAAVECEWVGAWMLSFPGIIFIELALWFLRLTALYPAKV
jgi:hypothetical protein